MRPDKQNYYLNIAKEVASRSPCSRRKFGAVIVKDDNIIVMGYNGSVRGTTNCGEDCECIKDLYKEEPNTSYVNCPSVHAEVNAIVNAARVGISVIGATMYITEANNKGSIPCIYCRRVILNSGIAKCVEKISDIEVSYQDVKYWAQEDKEWMKGKIDTKNGERLNIAVNWVFDTFPKVVEDAMKDNNGARNFLYGMVIKTLGKDRGYYIKAEISTKISYKMMLKKMILEL